MKTKKIIFGLSCLAILTVCILNTQSSLNVSSELGYTSLTDLILLNSASAEEGGSGCTGETCDEANGLKYSIFGIGSSYLCCGITDPSSGKKDS